MTDMRIQVTSVTDPEFRCYELDLQNTAGQTSTSTVSAGSTIGFQGAYLWTFPLHNQCTDDETYSRMFLSYS